VSVEALYICHVSPEPLKGLTRTPHSGQIVNVSMPGMINEEILILKGVEKASLQQCTLPSPFPFHSSTRKTAS